jgi:hypothetical protein
MPSTVRLAVIAFIAALFPTAACAYIDPGTGSLLAQTLIATLLTVGVAIRVYSQKIKRFINAIARRLRSDPKMDDSQR